MMILLLKLNAFPRKIWKNLSSNSVFAFLTWDLIVGAQPGCAIWLCTIQRLTIHAKISLNYAEKALKITHEGYYILLNKRSGVVASSKEEFLHIAWNLAVFSTSWLTFTCCWMAGLYCLATFCETQQISQESTCGRGSFKYSCRVPGCNFIKKKTLIQVFSCHSYKQVQNLVVLKSFSQPFNQNL